MVNTGVEIAGRMVGADQPCFVIAEAGVNHNGSKELALQLIEAAQAAGADSVKFQTFVPEDVATADAPKAAYQLAVTDPQESQLDMLRHLRLDDAFYPDLIAACKDAGLVFASTPYNDDDITFLDDLDVAYFKAASIHCAEPRFLQKLAETGRPIILSTGMADWTEVERAVQAVRATGNDRLILLQCTTNYPSELADANLKVIGKMRDRFGLPTGYSDHTTGSTACLAAVALGACVIERHLTLDTEMEGPDHASSDAPDAFARLVQGIRGVEQALGSEEKAPTAAEQKNMPHMRRSLVTRRALAAGQQITDADLICKRPADGLAPRHWADVVGRKAKHDIEAGAPLSWEDLDD